jgi:MFS family permease
VAGLRTRFARAMDVGGLPRQFWWLWAGTLVNRTGSFVAPFLAYYLTKSLGHSAGFAGLVAALNAVGAAISAVIGGVLADRVGRRVTLIGAQVAGAATMLALGLVHTAAWIAVLAFVVGLANNAYRPANSALIADIVPPEDRTRAFAVNFWAINLGFSIAMFAAGALASASYLLLFVGDAVTTLGSAVLIYLKVEDNYRPVRRTEAAATDLKAGTLADVFRDRIFMAFIAAALLVGVLYSQANATQPMAMAQDGLGPGVYGVVGALNGVVIVVLQLPMSAWLRRRYSAGTALAVGTLLQGGGFAVPLLITVVGWPTGMYIVSVCVWTIGEIACTPTENALVGELAPAQMRGRYQGVFTLMWSVAGVLGPLVGGWLMTGSGSAAVWWGSLALGVAGVPIWFLFARVAAPRLAESQTAALVPAAFAGPAAAPTAAVTVPDAVPAVLLSVEASAEAVPS